MNVNNVHNTIVADSGPLDWKILKKNLKEIVILFKEWI